MLNERLGPLGLFLIHDLDDVVDVVPDVVLILAMVVKVLASDVKLSPLLLADKAVVLLELIYRVKTTSSCPTNLAPGSALEGRRSCR